MIFYENVSVTFFAIPCKTYALIFYISQTVIKNENI